MEQHLARLARRWLPGFSAASPREQLEILAELVGIACYTPLAALSIGWLIAATDLASLRATWPLLLIQIALVILTGRLSFFWLVEYRKGEYVRYSSSLSVMVPASAMLLLGPSSLWATMVITLVVFGIRSIYRARALPLRLSYLRNVVMQAWTIGGWLAGAALYRAYGGRLPLADLSPSALLPALLVAVTPFVIFGLSLVVFTFVVRWMGLGTAMPLDFGQLGVLSLIAVTPSLFGILAAVLYARLGLAAYLFFMLGVLLVSFVAHRLSRATEQAQQRSREMERLERLGRAILESPADGSGLAEVLRAVVPGMFRCTCVDIRLHDGRTLLHYPEEEPGAPDALWSWLEGSEVARLFEPGEALPWQSRPSHEQVAVAPIRHTDTGAPLGGIFLLAESDSNVLAAALPAMQSLAAQVAAALHRDEEYTRAVEIQRTRQELDFAAQIQMNFLPQQPPRQFTGWTIAFSLESARETSGDFYDFIDLPGGRLGLLVADVSDKGAGAAMFMALSRTLIRTFAFEFPDDPALALTAANRRILTDSHTSMFVTVFYGVLDPRTGRLTYANAGHNPPLLLRQDRSILEWLVKTGIPLGITDELPWQNETVRLDIGDALVLYTDGVTEAHNRDKELFEETRLLEAARSAPIGDSSAMHDAIIAAIKAFVGGAPQFDDITLMTVSYVGASIAPIPVAPPALGMAEAE